MLWQWELVLTTDRLQSSHSGIKIESFYISFVPELLIKFLRSLLLWNSAFYEFGAWNEQDWIQRKFFPVIVPLFGRKFLIDINKQCSATESVLKLSSIKAIEMNETKQSSLFAAAKKQFRDDYHRIIVFMFLNRINMHFMFSHCFTNKRKKATQL